MTRFSHLDDQGRAHMVDVGDKAVTRRRAVAAARVVLQPETCRALREGSLKKGDALAVARVAGIQGAKHTAVLIPLCHPLPVDAVQVDLEVGEGEVLIRSEARVEAKTGVEMEALTAAATAALSLIDMVKGVDREAHIGYVRLELKEGGRSGRWTRSS